MSIVKPTLMDANGNVLFEGDVVDILTASNVYNEYTIIEIFVPNVRVAHNDTKRTYIMPKDHGLLPNSRKCNTADNTQFTYEGFVS